VEDAVLRKGSQGMDVLGIDGCLGSDGQDVLDTTTGM